MGNGTRQRAQRAPVLSFGMYRGQAITKVPASYLRVLLEKVVDLDPGLRLAIQAELTSPTPPCRHDVQPVLFAGPSEQCPRCGDTFTRPVLGEESDPYLRPQQRRRR